MDSSNAYSESVTESPFVAPARTERVSHRAASTRLSWIVLSLVTLLYLGTCFAPVIFDDNEGLYAGAVREMRQSGNWLVPLSNGFPRVQKPPLVYWTMLVATSLLGESEFALRLPNALATAGWIVATYLIMRRLGGERFGLASAVVLASMIGVSILFCHLVQPEPFMACFLSLAMWCLVEARLSAKPPELFAVRHVLADRFPGDGWYLLFWIFLALGTMSKGLHGALWPLGTVLLAALFVPGWRGWLRPVLSLRGVLAFILLVTPWYAYMAARFPGFLEAHFVNEQVGAALNTRYPADAKQLPLAQFYGQHFLFWMPWTMLLPGAIYAAVKAAWAARRTRHYFSPAATDIVKLLVCWFALTMVSVAFSTRQDYYSMSCWGVVAAFLAVPWFLPGISPLRMPRPYLVVPCALVTLGGALALGFAVWITPRLGALGAATATPIAQRDTFMDAIEGISPALWGHFILLLGIFGAAMLVAGAAATALDLAAAVFPRAARAGGRDGGAGWSGHSGVHDDGPLFLAGTGSPGDQSRVGRGTGCRGGLRGCAAHGLEPLLLSQRAGALGEHAFRPGLSAAGPRTRRRDLYWDDAALAKAWSEKPVYLIVDEDRLAYWQNALPGGRIIDQGGTRVVLGNR